MKCNRPQKNNQEHRNQMITSICLQNVFDIKYSFIIKALKLDTAKTYLNTIQANNQYHAERKIFKGFLSKIWTKKRMLTFANFIHHSIKSPSQSNQIKQIKGIPNEKELKLSLCN